MNKHLVNYVQWYISPLTYSEDLFFVKKMDNLVKIVLEKILSCLNSVIQLNDDTSSNSIDIAIKTLFNSSFLNSCKNYKTQFLNVEYLLILHSNSSRSTESIKLYIVKYLKEVSVELSRVFEYLIIQLTELYYIADKNVVQFWAEVSKDWDLRTILEKFYIKPLVKLKNSQLPFFCDLKISKHAIVLMDSYIVALIKEVDIRNGI